MQAQTATRFEDVLAHVTFKGGGWQGQPPGASPYGTRPEYGTRGVSHPRNGRAPAGVPPTNLSLLALREGSVVFGWRALRPPPVSCLL